MSERRVRAAGEPRRLRTDDLALSTQVVSLLVALAVFLVALAGVLVSIDNAGDDMAPTDAAAQQVRADGLADLLVVSQGVGWASGVDHVTRLGIGASNGSGLQESSIDAMRGAMLAGQANGKVDYAEAQASLGLDPAGDQQFHVRMYPVGMSAIYNSSLSGLRVAYIADFTSLGNIVVPVTTPQSQMPAYANTQANLTMAPSTAFERQALRGLGLDFVDRVYIGPSSPTVTVDYVAPLPDLPLLTVLGVSAVDGDVYPDSKQYLDDVLAGRLSQYDLIVVGSGVDHSTMTANVVKDGIRDWVNAGGTLVVLGSASQAYQWLQPLFFTGVSTVNGAPTAPDVSHPLLREPYVLDWTKYDSHNRGWDIKSQGSGAHYDDFSHIIVQGGEDVMAVSKDGAFGDGRIILTTYLPREIASTLGLTEAMHFMENIVLYTDRAHLYLEYGPTAPGETPVSVAIRQSWLWDERLGQVPIRLEVHTWTAPPST
jgi:hypothetical protein